MTNLIVNGSFEDTTGLNPTGFGYTGTPVGWTDANGNGFEIVNSGHVGQNASDGQYWIDSDGAWTNLDISQTIPNLQDGQPYTLGYDLSEWHVSSHNQLNVYWNGELIHTYDGQVGDNNDFDSFSHVVLGQEGDNVLRFEEVGSPDSAGIVIDNVSLYVASIPCFLKGTLIRTPQGERPIEAIGIGDLVCTLDHGDQPVIWAGSRVLGPDILARAPHLRPIRIRAGAAGNPRDLMVSPQHRLLTRNPMHLEPGQDAALIRAKHLVAFLGGPFRVAERCRSVTYHHILCDAHELVWANGMAAESMLIGDWLIQSQEALDAGLTYALPPRPTPMELCRPVVRSGLLRRRARTHTADRAAWRDLSVCAAERAVGLA